MTSTTTGFREAITSAATAALEIDFVAGRLEGPIRDRDLGCCYPASTTEDDENVTIKLITLMVRVFLRYDRSEEPTAPIDPEPLEAIAGRLETAVAAVENGTGGIWYSRITDVEYDLDRNAVEATIVGWDQGLFGDP